jgi:uncharacterized protein (TIGR00369 family)
MRRPLVFNADPEGEKKCFGCGSNNAAGLRLLFFETEDGVEVEYTAAPHLRGAPGILHGGIQATLLDETLCMAAYAKLGRPVVTGELTVRYLRPVPTETLLVARGRIIEEKKNSVVGEGCIYLVNADEPLTRAHGRFFMPQS